MMQISADRLNSADQLIALAQAPDPESRKALLLALGDLCAQKSFGVDQAAEIASEIFVRLARKAELAVRADLAVRLASTPWAPRELIVFLAHDEIEAAEPVLTSSPVLRESDLLAIAGELGQAHRRALAARPGLTEKVCEAVARPCEPGVVRALLRNETADITEPALQHCARAAAYHPDILTTLSERDISAEVAQTAYAAAGEALRREVVRLFPQHAEAIQTAMRATNSAAELARSADPTDLPANQRIVETLARFGRLDGPFLIASLEEGKLLLFELGLSWANKCGPDALRHAVARRGAWALALACRGAAMPASDYATVHRGLVNAGRMTGALDAAALRDCARIFAEKSPEEAASALRRIGADA